MSATHYRLIGDEVNETNATSAAVTVNDLTPGSYYTFTVWAVGAQSLVSNSITCINSTGEHFTATLHTLLAHLLVGLQTGIALAPHYPALRLVVMVSHVDQRS